MPHEMRGRGGGRRADVRHDVMPLEMPGCGDMRALVGRADVRHDVLPHKMPGCDGGHTDIGRMAPVLRLPILETR